MQINRRNGTPVVLTPDDVSAIKILKQARMSHREVGKVFGLHEGEVARVICSPKEREELISRANGICESCGDSPSFLVAHHVDYENDLVEILCDHCHGTRHTSKGEGYHPPSESGKQYREDLIELAKIDCT